MMQDYERTTELVTISQRSLGATEAQMAEYLQGMEAATNRVTTAYQKLVESITSSDAIIGLVNTAAEVLDNIAQFLSTDGGIAFSLAVIGGLALNMLSNMIAQKVEQAEINRLKQIETLEEEKKHKLSKLSQEEREKIKQSEAKLAEIAKAKAKLDAANLKVEQAKTYQKKLQDKLAKGELVTDAEIEAANQGVAKALTEQTVAQNELDVLAKD